MSSKKTKVIKVWELSQKGSQEQMAEFLASGPEMHRLDSLAQTKR